MTIRTSTILMLVCLMSAPLFFCGSKKIRANLTAEEHLQIAKKMFDDGDYLDAKTQFKIITLNFPGSGIVDQAQFYLAESHFKLKEYVLAIAEYEKLLRVYPNSALVDDAQYMIAMCNFKLSPKYSLDQKYTQKAIEEFQRFLEDYPTSELVPEAEKKLRQCRAKLAKKEYKTGELYRKMGNYKAALVYFESVLNTFYDTEYVEKAQYWKAGCLKELGRWAEASEQFQIFIEKYPRSSLVQKARNQLKEIQKKLLNVHEKPPEESVNSKP